MAQLSRRMGGRSTPNAGGNGTGNPCLEAFLTGLLSLCAPTYPESAIPCSFGQTTYYLCPSCDRGTHPLDQELGLCAGGISSGLANALGGVQLPFEEAAHLVSWSAPTPFGKPPRVWVRSSWRKGEQPQRPPGAWPLLNCRPCLHRPPIGCTSPQRGQPCGPGKRAGKR